MSEERVIALEIALKVVLNTAREQGIDVESLSEAAIDRLVKYHSYKCRHLFNAVDQIENTVDAPDWPCSAAR
jgi:hypothetical protein